MKMYKLGVIGFGSMGSSHFRIISNKSHDPSLPGYVDNVEVKGVFDLSPKRQQAAHDYGLVVYPSREELLADPEIDIVLVATTNEEHKNNCIAALAAGKHVICEKPVTMSSDELREVMEAAKKYDRLFTINQNRRVNRDFLLMREKVENGDLGKVYVIESRVEGSRGVPAGWRTIKRLGGGMMLDWGVHLIDQILFMLEEKVTQVYCKMLSVQYPEVDDNFHLHLTFESGLSVLIEVSTNNYITHPRWYVSGERGTMVIEDWECNGKIVRRIDTDDVWEEEVVMTAAGPTKTMAPRNPESTETIELSAPQGVTDSLSKSYDQLTAAIEGKEPLAITGEQAMRVMLVMEAAFQSAKSNRSVDVEI